MNQPVFNYFFRVTVYSDQPLYIKLIAIIFVYTRRIQLILLNLFVNEFSIFFSSLFTALWSTHVLAIIINLLNLIIILCLF